VSADNNAIAAPKDCTHTWEPAGMVFETQLLDPEGRVRVRQPDLEVGRCYFICRTCASHTYMATQWIGYRLHGSDDALQDQSDTDGYNRKAWTPDTNE
jgi:hypothetical protein